MTRFLGILCVALALCACTSTQVQTSQKSLITACSAYATSLSTLADFRMQGKLNVATINVVDQVVNVTSPLCDPAKPLPTDISSTIYLVEDSGIKLTQLIAGVK